MASPAKCRTCDGTGKTVHMHSWFTTDGFYRIRCGICGGTGQSSHRSGNYEEEQRRLRELARRRMTSLPRETADVGTTR